MNKIEQKCINIMTDCTIITHKIAQKMEYKSCITNQMKHWLYKKVVEKVNIRKTSVLKYLFKWCYFLWCGKCSMKMWWYIFNTDLLLSLYFIWKIKLNKNVNFDGLVAVICFHLAWMLWNWRSQRLGHECIL